MMRLNEKIVRFFYKWVARYYLGNVYFEDWLWEKYQRPSTILRMIFNQLCFLLKLNFVPFLLSVNIDPVCQCNQHCKLCRGRYVFPRIKDNLSPRLFGSILKNLPRTVETVQLALFGEPLLHPKISLLIKQIEKYGFRSILITNGTLLTNRLSEQLLRSPLNVINVSFETDPQNALEMRGVNLDDLTQKVNELLELRKKLGSKVKIQLALVLHKKNYKYLLSFLNQWREKVDAIKVSPAFYLDQKRQPGLCSELWRGNLNILPNGWVSACCTDFLCQFVIGNVKTTSPTKIWNGVLLKKLRANLLAGRYPKKCQYCTTEEVGNLHRFKTHGVV